MSKEKLTRDQFINGVNDKRKIKKARVRIGTENVLLAASGRVPYPNTYKKVLFTMTPEIEEEIAKYCTGTRQAIMIYLITRGLEELKKDNKKIIFELDLTNI